MSTPTINQSNPFRMHQLHQVQLPGMNQLLAKLAFWSSMKPFAVARNWITPSSTPTKFEALALIVGTILLMHPGPFRSDLSTMVQPSNLPQLAPKSNSCLGRQPPRNSSIALTSNQPQRRIGIQLMSPSAHCHRARGILWQQTRWTISLAPERSM